MAAGEQLLPEGEKVVQEPSSPASADPSPQPQAQPQPEPEPKPDPAAIAAEAEKLKEQGNESFKRKRYGDAIDLYTKAIGAVIPIILSVIVIVVFPPFPLTSKFTETC
jgi:outer membrane biosynthesis protein TonB